MKKTITIILLIIFAINSHAQIYNQKVNEKFSRYDLKLYESYSKDAINYQYGAIGCATVSAGLLIGFGCVKNKYEINDKGNVRMTLKAKSLAITGGVFAGLAIVAELCAIDYKIQANKYLQLHLSGDKAALSYSF